MTNNKETLNHTKPYKIHYFRFHYITKNEVERPYMALLYYPRPVPASVAHLDACPTGDQEVASSTPAGSATFFRGD